MSNVNFNAVKAAPNGFVTGASYNTLVDLVRSLVISDSPDYRVQRNLGGTKLNINFPAVYPKSPATSTPAVAAPSSFPWNVTNTTSGSTAQVQLNGGDGYVATLNGFVCNVNSIPNDSSGSGYPQLSITDPGSGNDGYIYAYAVPATAGTANPLASLDLSYQTDIQTPDATNPNGYCWMLVATVSNYVTSGSNVTFNLNKVYGPAFGPSSLVYCGGVFNPPY
jgi:hypothetical protein